MKSFSVAIFDNDYNALIDKVIVNAKDKGLVDTWCCEQSWSGYDYMCIEELDIVSSKAEIEING